MTAIGSSGLKPNLVNFKLSFFNPVSENPQRERFHLSVCLFTCRSVGQHTRKLIDLGDPAAIRLDFELNRKIHRHLRPQHTLIPGSLGLQDRPQLVYLPLQLCR